MPMTLGATQAAVMLVSLLNVGASGLDYFDPQGADRSAWNYAVHGSGSIPRELGEKVVSGGEEVFGYAANSVIALVNMEYVHVQTEIRRLVENTMGIAEEFSVTAKLDSVHESADVMRALQSPWPPLGIGLSIFSLDVEGVGAPREYEIYTRPYNQIEGIGAYSRARIRLVDGSSFLGKSVTIIQVSRNDVSREWARSHIGGIPLPWKEVREFTLVTNTEIGLIERLTSLKDTVRIKYFVPRTDLLFIDKAQRRYFREALGEAVRGFGTENRDRLNN